MDPELIELLIYVGLSLLLLAVGLFSGRITEGRHYRSLKEREAQLRGLILTNLRNMPLPGPVSGSRFVSGQVVISTDYFKSICAALRSLVGGNVRSFETLLERGRREAILRLAEQALASGASLVLNVRFETMPIYRSGQGRRGGITGVEVVAYGTALRF
ncbi:MAG TPA: heavy metal-binding domain-containing protein [Planctomycetota bacterium]|nr:heavy metal-binding domain-containing protein [Planctomycetota bacterium]